MQVTNVPAREGTPPCCEQTKSQASLQSARAGWGGWGLTRRRVALRIARVCARLQRLGCGRFRAAGGALLRLGQGLGWWQQERRAPGMGGHGAVAAASAIGGHPHGLPGRSYGPNSAHAAGPGKRSPRQEDRAARVLLQTCTCLPPSPRPWGRLGGAAGVCTKHFPLLGLDLHPRRPPVPLGAGLTPLGGHDIIILFVGAF